MEGLMEDEFGLRIRGEGAVVAPPFLLRVRRFSHRVRFAVLLGAIAAARVPRNILR